MNLNLRLEVFQKTFLSRKIFIIIIFKNAHTKKKKKKFEKVKDKLFWYFLFPLTGIIKIFWDLDIT